MNVYNAALYVYRAAFCIFRLINHNNFCWSQDAVSVLNDAWQVFTLRCRFALPTAEELKHEIEIKQTIVTTIEKFTYTLLKIGTNHKDNHFAIIIDEAPPDKAAETPHK